MDPHRQSSEPSRNKKRFLGRFPVGNNVCGAENIQTLSENRDRDSQPPVANPLSSVQTRAQSSNSARKEANRRSSTMEMSLSTSFGADFDENFLTEMDRIEKKYKESTKPMKQEMGSAKGGSSTRHGSPALSGHYQGNIQTVPGEEKFLTPVGKPRKGVKSEAKKCKPHKSVHERTDIGSSGLNLSSSDVLPDSPMYISTPVDHYKSQLRGKTGPDDQSDVISQASSLPSHQNVPKRTLGKKTCVESSDGIRKQLKLETVVPDSSMPAESHHSQNAKGDKSEHHCNRPLDVKTISTSKEGGGCDEPVTPSINDKLSLSSWGLPTSVLERYHAMGISTLFEWQAECLCSPGVLDGANLVYSAPTSAGKTLVAELLMLKRVVETGTKAILILPFVSVVREKVHTLQTLFQDIGVRVDGYMGSHSPTGGFAAVNIAVCTIEKANSLVNRLMEEDQMKLLGTLVVDELHMVGDEHRGYLLELLLTKVRYLTRAITVNAACQSSLSPAHQITSHSLPEVQVVGMSATLPNLPLLAAWLNAQLYITHYRPVPLTELVKIGPYLYDSAMLPVRTFSPCSSLQADEDDMVSLCLETTRPGHSVLVFCPAKNWCEKLALNVARQFYGLVSAATDEQPAPTNEEEFQACTARVFGRPLNGDALHDVLEQLKRSPAGVDQTLMKTLALGVAFHHAGLTFDERDIVESAFRKGTLRVLIATSTLSSGVNLPARRVIIRTPIFYGTVIDTLTYKQMVGRAGRKGVDTAGESILVCKANEKTRATQLVTSDLPPVHSCLAKPGSSLSGSLKRAILEIVVSGVASTPTEVARYAKGTLLAASLSAEEGATEGGPHIHDCVQYLQDHEFITLTAAGEDGVDKYTATQLGCAVLSSALGPDEGLTVLAELQRARRCFVLENDLHLLYLVTPLYMADQLGSSLDWYQFLCFWEALPPDQRRVGELVGVQDSFLSRAVSGRVATRTGNEWRVVQVHRRFYLALALHELIQEATLSHVSHKYKCSKGMLQSLQQAAATFAGMVVVFCRSLGWVHLELLLAAFQSRLTFGVQRELVDLVRLSLLNAQRARTLYNAGLQTVAQIATAQPSQIEALLKKAVPFQTKKTGADESEWEASERQRRQTRGIYVAGSGEALTEAEAAVVLVEEAKSLLAADLAKMGVHWTGSSKPDRPEDKPQTPVKQSPQQSVKSNAKPKRRSLSRSQRHRRSGSINKTPASSLRIHRRSPKARTDDSSSVKDESSCILSPPPDLVKQAASRRLSCGKNISSTEERIPVISPIQTDVMQVRHESEVDRSTGDFTALRDNANKSSLLGKRKSQVSPKEVLNNCLVPHQPTAADGMIRPDKDAVKMHYTSGASSKQESGRLSTESDEKSPCCAQPLPHINGSTCQQDERETSSISKHGINKSPPSSMRNTHGSFMEDSFVVDTQTLDLITAFPPNHQKPTNATNGDSLTERASSSYAADGRTSPQPHLCHSASPNMFSEDPKSETTSPSTNPRTPGFTESTSGVTRTCSKKSMPGICRLLDPVSPALLPASNFERQAGEYPSAEGLFADDSIIDESQALINVDENQSRVFADENGCFNSMEIDDDEGHNGGLNDQDLDKAMGMSFGIDFSCSDMDVSKLSADNRRTVGDSNTNCAVPQELNTSPTNIVSEMEDSLTLSMMDNAMKSLSAGNYNVGLTAHKPRQNEVSKPVTTANHPTAKQTNKSFSPGSQITALVDLLVDGTTPSKARAVRDEDVGSRQAAVAEDEGQVSVDNTSAASDYIPPTPPKSDSSIVTRADTPKRLIGGVSTPTKSGGVRTPTKSCGVITSTKSGGVSTPSKSGGVSIPTKSGGVSTPTKSGGVRTPTKSGGVSTPTKSGRVSIPTKSGGVSIPTQSGGVSTPTKSGGVSIPSKSGALIAPSKSLAVSSVTKSNTVNTLTKSTPPRTQGDVVNSSLLTSQSLTIIDVAADHRLFDTFLQEWQEQETFSLCVACDKLSPNPSHLNQPITIGSNFTKDREARSDSSEGSSLHEDERLSVVEEGVVVCGVAVSWHQCDAYYITLTSQHSQECDLDESLAPPPLDLTLCLNHRLKAISDVLQNKNLVITSLDAKSQYKLLGLTCGVHVAGQLRDPGVAAWLIDPAAKPASIHRLAASYTPHLTHLLDGVGGGIGYGSLGLLADNPSSGRVRACVEAILLHHIMEPMSAQLDDTGLLQAFTHVEMPIAVILARMELNGMGVSGEELERLQQTMQDKLGVLEQQAYSMARHPFSLTSPADIAQVLFVELKLPPSGDPTNPAISKTLGMSRRNTGKGKPKQGFSTSKEILEKLQLLHPIAGVILEWRRLSSTLAKVVFPLINAKVHSPMLGMDRIYGVSDTHTATGRVTMREPNLQNIPNDFTVETTDLRIPPNHSSRVQAPITTEPTVISMRRVFLPFKGAVLLAADYSQLELRMIAHLSHDRQLTAILNSGGDVFKTIAAQWKAVNADEVTDHFRQQAKQVCYGMIYGIGVKALGEQLGVSEEDAAVFVETFKARYAGMRRFLTQSVKFAQENGYVQTITGRRRYLPAIRDTVTHARAHAERQAVNTTVQGSAADLVKTAMVQIESTLQKQFPSMCTPHRSKSRNARASNIQLSRRRSERCHSVCPTPTSAEGAFLILQLHDELVYEVSLPLLQQVTSIIKTTMETAMTLDVCLPVKVKVGASWGSLEDFKPL